MAAGTLRSAMAKDSDADLTIDELAQRTGMTVRNIRAHQSRGLLPGPVVRGRTGYYGQDHIARVELIKELQADGYNLDLIRKLLEGAGGSSPDVLRFTRGVRAPFGEEEPEITDLAELAERWKGAPPETLSRAQELGLLRPLGDGKFEEISPSLMQAGTELAALGLPVEKGLELLGKLRRNADSAARAFIELFIEEVWKPFEREGQPEERWPEVVEALERLRPLASQSLLATFQLAMTDAVERAVGRELARMADEDRRGKRKRK